MNPAGSRPSPGSSNLLGYDVVRLAAMVCVAAQHVLSISAPGAIAALRPLDLGRLGVAIFCALSGVLAPGGGGDPVGWLARRLARLAPPYWLMLAAIFVANAVVGYKPVTAGLVVAEALGVAYFTHPGSLVGVHVWFMSLILVCYGFGALLRWDRRLLPACAVAAGVLAPLDPGLTDHVLAFLAGATVAVLAGPGRVTGWLAAAALVAAAVRPGLPYPLAATTAVVLGGLARGRSPRALAQAGRASYEFFLVHGPIYLGLAKLAGIGLPGVATLGTAAAIAATWALRRADRAVRSALARGRPDPARRPAAPPGRRESPEADHSEVAGSIPGMDHPH
jgi:peptidoglycan/LPS O-acetylase OafA/YrhL